jgi:hypothetical protein
MAELINKAQIKKIKVTDYATIRDQLQTGDLVFCSGNYFFSKIIQGLTKSGWSHVGVIYKDKELDRILLLESEVLIGVRLIPLSKYLKNYKDTKKPYKGNMIIAKLSEPPTPINLNKGISFGLDELCRPYDNYEIFRILIRMLFKITKREKNKLYICSELVRDIYRKANKKFELEDGYISPDGIWKDKDVVQQWRIL